LKGYIIYCDPPYQGSDNYYLSEERKKTSFDQDKFWDWCRVMSRENIIFISGYTAPRGFIKCWGKTISTTSNKGNSTIGKESLYLL
jgi:DNA adenine methylase